MQAKYDVAESVLINRQNPTKIISRELMIIDNGEYLEHQWVYVCDSNRSRFYKESNIQNLKDIKRELKAAICVRDYCNKAGISVSNYEPSIDSLNDCFTLLNNYRHETII
jgi:hypothetical protein